jgi:hypothetical protein
MHSLLVFNADHVESEVPSIRVSFESGRVGTNSARLGTNSGRLGTNSGRLGTNSARLGTNSGRMGTNSARLGTNSGRMGTNNLHDRLFQVFTAMTAPPPSPVDGYHCFAAMWCLHHNVPIHRPQSQLHTTVTAA